MGILVGKAQIPQNPDTILSPPLPPAPDFHPVPIDGGILFIALAGSGAYAYRKLKSKTKK